MKKIIPYFLAAFVCGWVGYSLFDDTEVIGKVDFDRNGIEYVEVVRIGDAVEVRVQTLGDLTCNDVTAFLELSPKVVSNGTWVPECRHKKPGYIVVRYEKWKSAL